MKKNIFLHFLQLLFKRKSKNSKLTKIKTELENTRTELANISTQLGELKLYSDDMSERYELLQNILKSNPEKSTQFNTFKHIVENDFINFANEEASLAEEAGALLKIQDLTHELELITTFPEIYRKNIIAIGGGFSSGKTSFINSLFDTQSAKQPISLPVGMEPVTAIPTYVMKGDHNSLFGMAQNGEKVEIPNKLSHKLNHEFLKNLGFNLRTILP